MNNQFPWNKNIHVEKQPGAMSPILYIFICIVMCGAFACGFVYAATLAGWL